MQTLIVPAPAKVNLFLHVTGRRADGYHTLESLFVADRSRATRSRSTRRDDGAIRARGRRRRACPRTTISRVRAARALQDATGSRAWRRHRASTSASRWAAGWAAAAPTRRACCSRSTGCGSSDCRARELAAHRRRRSAPTFRSSSAASNAIARGIGEALTPVSLPPCWVALAFPPRARADRGRSSRRRN